MISFTGLLDLLQQRKFMSETVNLFCSELLLRLWLDFFFQTSFFNLFAFTEIVVQAIRFILERSSKESSGTCI